MTAATPQRATEEPESFDVAAAQDAVTSDPDLLPVEKETNISFSNVDNEATVYTENATLVRDLLGYPEFTATEFRVSNEKRFGVRMSPVEWQADRGPITGVKGTLPIGCLKVPARRRQKDWVSLIVSDQATEELDS